MTGNENLQWALVGSLIADRVARRSALSLIKTYGMKSEYITVPELRTLYDILIEAKSDDRIVLFDIAIKKCSEETITKASGSACLMTDDIAYAMSQVKNAGVAAKALQIALNVQSELQGKASGEFIAVEMARKMTDFSISVIEQAKVGGYSLEDIGDPIPEEEDPNCLFKGRFLEKGAGLVLASVSGSGKSVISLQLAMSWAIGRPIFGITPMRPLKIGIFQTEDSPQDIAQFAYDICCGYRDYCGWSDEDLAEAKKNIRFFDPMGAVGDKFLLMLRKEQMVGQFDLIIINPLTGVTDFDISNNAEMNAFLIEKLDPIIKHDPQTKCGLIIVHHTNKPPPANQRTSFATDQYSQYIGAGASKLSNWMRSMLGVMPVKDMPGHYYFTAAKRGERLHWPAIPERKFAKPTRIIRHSTHEENLMFWHEVSLEGGATTPENDAKQCSATEDAAELAAILCKTAMTLTEARNCAKKMFSRKRGEIAYAELVSHLSAYSVVVKPTGSLNKSLIGSRESVENWFSTARGKLAAGMRL